MSTLDQLLDELRRRDVRIWADGGRLRHDAPPDALTGAAYVPVDPRDPPDRIAVILAEARARLLVTERALVAGLPAASPPLLMRDAGPAAELDGDHDEDLDRDHDLDQTLSRDDTSRVVCATSICFDLSIFELCIPLVTGGAVLLVQDALALADAPALADIDFDDDDDDLDDLDDDDPDDDDHDGHDPDDDLDDDDLDDDDPDDAPHPDDAGAVIAGAAQLTYRELDARANQLAHDLQALAVGPDTLVGICLDRSADLVVALLAVLKAGAAYLPLDPGYPPARLAYMLADSRAPVLVTRSHFTDRLPPYAAHRVCLDTDRSAIARRPVTAPATRSHPLDLAYCIYTSGSTGARKGIEVPHRGVVNLVTWHREAYRLRARIVGEL